MSHAIKNLAHGTLIYGFGQAANRLVGFLLLPLFTAYLSPRDYGVISLLALVTFVITQVVGLGFGVSLGIVYYKQDDQGYRQTTIWTAFFILLISSICALVLLTLYSKQISYLLFQVHDFSTLIIYTSVAAVCGGVLSQPFIMKMQFENKATRYTVVNLIATLITTALNVVFVILLRQGVEGWVLSNLIGALISFLLFLVVSGGFPVMPDRLLASTLVRLGLPMIPSFLFILVMQHSGRYMLQLERGLADVGIYNIGYTFGTIVTLAVSAFTTAWYPYFNSFVNRQDEGRDVFSKVTTYYVIIFGLLGVFFFVFARPLVQLFTQVPFHESHRVIGPITLANIFSGLFSLTLPGIYFAQEVKLVNIVQIVCCCLVIILNALMIPSMGMVGAAVAMAAGFILMPLLQLFLNKKRCYLAIDYQWKRMIHFIFLFTVAILPVYIVPLGSIFQNMLISSTLLIAALSGSWLLLEQPEKLKVKQYLGIMATS